LLILTVWGFEEYSKHNENKKEEKKMISELPDEKLRWSCHPQVLGCNTSQEVKPLTAIIGQERAVKALQFGLGIKEPGFNIKEKFRPSVE
jgi:hypothetical protein